MLNGNFGILLFVFFAIVFVALLCGGAVARKIKQMRQNAKQAADQKDRSRRDEIGRQNQQYHYKAHTASRQQSRPEQPQAQQPEPAPEPEPEQPQERRTQTATGETIIDNRHQQRENRKIFDDADGEYVEFSEE